jgi:hypothetical protein
MLSVVRRTLLLALALAGVTASADEVATGSRARLERSAPLRYRHVFTVYRIDETGADLLAFGAGARVGDALEVVDARGYVGRLMIDHVEARGCGAASYLDVRARFVARLPGRATIDAVLALAPARRPPGRARLLEAAEVPDAPAGGEGLQAIDVDGDGVADLAHYQFHTCGRRAVSDDSAACFETWERVAGSWRRLERAEFPMCDR